MKFKSLFISVLIISNTLFASCLEETREVLYKRFIKEDKMCTDLYVKFATEVYLGKRESYDFGNLPYDDPILQCVKKLPGMQAQINKLDTHITSLKRPSSTQ